MASFRINFQAQTTGDHYIGYRTYNDPPNTYTVLTVNITGAVPQLAHVDIPVPGNLYCAYAGIRYDGYIIAACELLPGEDPATAIPAAATTWSVKLAQQTDPCIRTNILCEAVGIYDITYTPGVTGCTPDGIYKFDIVETNPGDEIVPAIIEITVTSGAFAGITILDPGLYKAAPVITLPPLVSGCTPSPVFTAIMDDCPQIDLTDYICAGHIELSGSTLYDIALGEDLDLCADTSTLGGLPTGYLATPGDNCHCKDCVRAHITMDGPAGYITISYQRCWDDNTSPVTLITRTITVTGTPLSVDLGCIIDGTLHIDDSTLPTPGAYTVLHIPCV
jgi:hypothetical protein